jgi:hypothetical protein
VPVETPIEAATRPSLEVGAGGIALIQIVFFLLVLAGVPAKAETRRLCDRQVSFQVVPPANVPPSLSLLSGIWTGTVLLAGGSEMCVSMVVKEVKPDGDLDLLVTWNVSIGGRDDINNFVGMGEAPNWLTKVEDGKFRLDSGKRWRGVHYHYVMKVPSQTKPDVMEGRWMADTHSQPVRLYREKRG